ncbi:hypothetical protein CARUB_v10011814mg [Capsella rubella]|uniref:F-box domain-containing protein n=1 Tax=Capsella rubella TaxID=81985 RepID=R0GLG3_9BRAS|nr:hypothetical protein CARUB_v10011814mg [Capsella rubella]
MESHLPVDLVIDILSRVSAKSIDRFRCVSKLWESILGHPHFKELFLTQSLARPRLLFTFKANEELFVFSSPQPQNPRENSTLVATPYKCFPKYFPTDRCTSHRRLVFLQRGKTGRVVFNPVTGESITLPKVKATGIKISYLGFDPISKQFKVLCMTRSRYGTPDTHRILTLMETGKGRHLWRTIQDSRNCYVFTGDLGICINGILYYNTYILGGYFKIGCFDFRLEKFGFIKYDKDMKPLMLTLFNYKGKLGVHQKLMGERKSILWVLEEDAAGEHIWSKQRICILPSIVYPHKFVGMTGTGEIVFSPHTCCYPFYLFFYNIESSTATRIHFHGFEELKHHPTSVLTSLDFVEDVQAKFI